MILLILLLINFFGFLFWIDFIVNVFFFKGINLLIDWIDEEHGEYALAIASDHGGQLYFGEDTLCNPYPISRE